MGLYLIDQYSLLHFSVGVVFYFWGITFWRWTIIHLIFELFENTPSGIYLINNYFKFWPGGKTHADSLLNSTGDIVFGCLGWFIAKWFDELGKKYKLTINQNIELF